MGKPTGFMEFGRELPKKKDPSVRIQDNKEFVLNEEFGDKINQQASRCMDCGVPFCHNGCPIGNIIPEFNDAVYRDSWEEAWNILSSTNNFPEFTGRVCPAPCETACVLGINQTQSPSVTSKRPLLSVLTKKVTPSRKRHVADPARKWRLLAQALLACLRLSSLTVPVTT